MSTLSSTPQETSSLPEEVPSAERSHSPRALYVLMFILVVGALLRLGLWAWFWDLEPRINDELSYNNIALNIVQHGEFAEHPGQPTSIRPPLYPATVAGLYALFGENNYQAVRLFQIVLSLITAVLIYRLGVVLYSEQVGLWAAAFFCFYPSFLGYNNLILTEVLFTFFLCALCYTLALAIRQASFGWLACAGVLIGLGALTRSILWLFPPVLALFLLFAWRGPSAAFALQGERGARANSWKGRLLASCTVAVAAAVTIAPWAIRNTQLQKTFLTVDCMGGRNFMMGNYQHTPMYRSWDAISLQGKKSWLHEVITTYPPEMRGTQGKLDKLAMKQGVTFVLAHPWLTFKRDVVKFFDFWGLERSIPRGVFEGFFGPISGEGAAVITVLVLASSAAALFLGVFGVILAPPEDRRVHLLFLLLVVFVCGIHTLVFAHARYRLPLMPLFFLYGASALVHARTLWHQRHRPVFWLPVTLCLVLMSGWVVGMVLGDLDRIRTLLGGI